MISLRFTSAKKGADKYLNFTSLQLTILSLIIGLLALDFFFSKGVNLKEVNLDNYYLNIFYN